MKKQTLLLALLAVTMMAAGCTSKNVEGESAEANELTEATTSDAGFEDEFGSEEEVAADSSGEAADDFGDDSFGESSDSAGEGQVAADPEAAGTADDLAALEEDLGGDSGFDESGDFGADTTGDMAADQTETADSGFSDSDFSSDELSGLSADAPSSYDTTAENTTSFDSGMDSGYAEAPTYIPLKKMLTTPYTKNGVLVNTIYIARDGDTLSSIAQKIYGMDRSDELRSVNGHLASRDVKVGDKIYYNSPNRPTDNSQIITFYEDLNLQPEIYPAQAGENIRAIGKKLLGHENSWKEIWATNMDIESKDILPLEASIRYWPGTSTPSMPPMPTQASMDQAPPMNEPMDMPPPMPEEVAQATPPPPPEFDQPAAMEPPPPAPEMAPPPPAPAPSMAERPKATPVTANLDQEGGSLLDDPDQTMALAAGIILLTAALALIIIIRKKKRANRGIDFHTATHTQIE